jgi:hypothetical protein
VLVWDTAREFGATDVLVRDTVIGKSLAPRSATNRSS